MTEAGRGPLLTADTHALMMRHRAGAAQCECSLDLGLTQQRVGLLPQGFTWNDSHYAWPAALKDRTIYHWDGSAFAPVSIYAGSLIKLVPTPWGAPTFEIDGIKMLPTAKVSPFEDARGKVELVGVRGRRVLDTCGGFGHFAAWCCRLGATRCCPCEKSPAVLWLRSLNPWSPGPDAVLEVLNLAIERHIATLADASF